MSGLTKEEITEITGIEFYDCKVSMNSIHDEPCKCKPWKVRFYMRKEGQPTGILK